MDLLATVRKEGSRGGTGDFKWSDVQNSSRRENYLGHSVMAPVGRWQKGRDLSWYAKGEGDGEDGQDAEEKAKRERKEEIQRVKEAEEDALARALGLPVAPRNNANLEPLGDKRAMDRLVKETAEDGGEGGKGIGFGSLVDRNGEKVLGERIEGSAEAEDKELHYALKEYRRRHGNEFRGERSQSRDRERRHRHSDRDRKHHRRKHRSRSRDRRRNERNNYSRPKSRSRSRSRDREAERFRKEYRSRDRSRSPERPRREDRRERYSHSDDRRTRRD